MILIHDKRRLVGLISATIKIKFIDDAGRNSLVVLAQEEEKRVRACGENVHQRLRVMCLDGAKSVGDLFSQECRVLTTSDTLLSGARWQGERDESRDIRKIRRDIRGRLNFSILGYAYSNRDLTS